MTYVAREIEDTLKRLIQSSSEHKNVILVDGARQVGKSCLVEHVLESIHTEKIEINLEVNAVLRSKIDECRQFSEFNDLLVDEFELDQLLRAIDALDNRLDGDKEYDKEPSLYGQLRDEHGYRVPGCYSIMPAPVEL